MNKQSIVLVLIVSLLSLCVYLGAQEADEASVPKADKSADGALEVTIDDLRGTVEVKEDLNKDWVQATKGMKLKEGAKVSTGFKSKASLLFGDNSVFVVKSLTQMTINRFLQDKDTVETKIKLRIGNIRLKVKDDQPVKTDLKVTTPNATCSVRGTDVKGIETSPDMGDTYSVASGHVRMETIEGRTRSLQGGESTNQDLINPIEHNLLQTAVDIMPFGATVAEAISALTSVAVPIIPDILIGDVDSETGNPVVEGDIVNQGSGGCDGPDEPPPTCSCGSGCPSCSYCGYPLCECPAGGTPPCGVCNVCSGCICY